MTDYLTEYDLLQYTIHRPKQVASSKTERTPTQHTKWSPESDRESTTRGVDDHETGIVQDS